MRRVLLIILLCILIEGGCFWKIFEIFDFKFERNPDLEFLAGDTLSHSVHLTNPVVSPDGKTVYYLCAPGDSISLGDLDYAFGAIYAINVENKNKKLILKGKYRFLTISPDGKKLAVQSMRGSYLQFSCESLILVINLKNLNVDTYPLPVRGNRIIDLKFSPIDTNYIYYLSCKNIYRLNLLDGSIELILSDVRGGFDIFKDGEIYTNDPYFSWIEINPINEDYLIGHMFPVFDTAIVMRKISDNKIIRFEYSAFCPYFLLFFGNGWLGQPYWFPDGNTVVFCYSLPSDPGGEPAELWILRNVFKHIKGGRQH